MQDIHSFESSGGGGRLFSGGGDSRLRPHDYQDMKCPRCDSANTKFCYYNNYNLSQPRHFCKSCRRYWTKGGVLRNVPVGGGIRKPKRTNKPKSKTNISCSDAVSAERKSSNSENSSSESSSLTANTTTPNTTTTTTTDVSGSNSMDSTPTMLLSFKEPSRRFFNIPQSSIPNTTFDPLMLNQSSTGNRSSEIGTFTSMMTSSNDQESGIPSFQIENQNTEHVVENQNPNPLQWTAETMGFMDQSEEIELSRYESRRNNDGLPATEDWQDNTDEGLFDLTGGVDQSYWNQSQWNDGDDHQHLNYLP